MLYYSMPALAAGFILDLMIGDPRWLYHPVCLIGNLIAFLEKILRKIFPKTDKGELAAGMESQYGRDSHWKPSGVISFWQRNL